VATPQPIAVQPSPETPAPATPVLRGANPDFTPKADGETAKVGNASAIPAPTAKADSGASTSSTSPSATIPEPAGPAGLKVARQFASAFVLYETGQNSAEVRTAFAATATPRLAHSLLRRPPRLPGNVKVPQAKVVNVVPGPKVGKTYTVSVSLLRVGLTSELRLSMMERGKSGEWRVTDVRG
jgi:hypothetical protein